MTAPQSDRWVIVLSDRPFSGLRFFAGMARGGPIKEETRDPDKAAIFFSPYPELPGWGGKKWKTMTLGEARRRVDEHRRKEVTNE